MSLQVEAVLFIFGLVALGYLAALTGYLRLETGDALGEFAVGVAVPLLLFRTMSGADFHGASPWSLWAVYFPPMILVAVAGYLATTRLFGRDAKAGVVGGVSACFSNTVLLGIPLVLGVYGQAGFEQLALIVTVHLPLMMAATTVAFVILDRGGGKRLSLARLVADFLLKLVANPMLVGIGAGLAWRFLGLPLPGLASRFVSALADVAGPLALFAMGVGLKRYGVSGNLVPGLVLAALKLLAMPAAVLCACLLLGLPPLAAQVAVVTAAMPSGVNCYLIAVQFGTGQALASNAMTIATGLAVLSVAFWASVLHAVYG